MFFFGDFPANSACISAQINADSAHFCSTTSGADPCKTSYSMYLFVQVKVTNYTREELSNDPLKRTLEWYNYLYFQTGLTNNSIPTVL